MIDVGSGPIIGNDRIMRHVGVATDPAMYQMSITTGYGNTGEWEIPSYIGQFNRSYVLPFQVY